jgi:TolB protein
VKLRAFLLFFAIFSLAFSAPAQRRPVLPQIDLPHPYYYREMYLPQLTSGPSSLAWSPNSKELVYSMAGSLWRQKLDSKEAVQLTDGAGYDYQPDWSPDGKTIVYTSYQKDAMELRLLDVASGKTTQLTSGGAVNVEPRWSPDGKKIVFVSTQYNKRFHIFRADFTNGKLENVVQLTGETKSSLPRYYYSSYDMEINPVWTRDAQEILFVSNRGHIHGTGGFWRMKAEPGAEAREIHYEETNWKARPDFSPDGSRMVYTSYLGRQWHNLWLMPANGGDAFPISYGDWDETNVRWSPDGDKIAFISNEGGNISLMYQNASGGDLTALSVEKRKYLNAHFPLVVNVASEDTTRVRMSVTDANGKFYAPSDAWVFADDGFDRSSRQFETHYFHTSSTAYLEVPAGKITIEVTRGLEYAPEKRTVEVQAGKPATVIMPALSRIWDARGDRGQWISGDLHVHMNYGGTYRNNSLHLAEQAEAEDLAFVNNLVVNKEQRFPDIVVSGKGEDPAAAGRAVVVHGQEFHTSYWGHRGLLGIQRHILLPGYAGYPNTAAASLYPMNADVYDIAHAQGALVGAVHPFDAEPDPFANPPPNITDELPVDVALGKLDYMEIVGFSDHKSTAAVWYRLLNLGFRIPAGAGTDATVNYAAPIRSQVGIDRVYAWVPLGPVDSTLSPFWFEALRHGRTFATNGPLLEFHIPQADIGDDLQLKEAQTVQFTAKLRSIAPVDHLEVVCNGKVAKDLKLEKDRRSVDMEGTLPLKESGWCVLRTWSDTAEYPVMDKYAYATTSPIYVTIADRKPRSPKDAKYFAAWIQRTIEVTENYPDWNSAEEKEGVRKKLKEAQKIYEGME